MKKKNGYKMTIKLLEGIWVMFSKICEATSDEDIILQCDKISTAINGLKQKIMRKAKIK